MSNLNKVYYVKLGISAKTPEVVGCHCAQMPVYSSLLWKCLFFSLNGPSLGIFPRVLWEQLLSSVELQAVWQETWGQSLPSWFPVVPCALSIYSYPNLRGYTMPRHPVWILMVAFISPQQPPQSHPYLAPSFPLEAFPSSAPCHDLHSCLTCIELMQCLACI